MVFSFIKFKNNVYTLEENYFRNYTNWKFKNKIYKHQKNSYLKKEGERWPKVN